MAPSSAVPGDAVLAGASGSPFYITAPLLWPLVLGLRVLGVDADALLERANISADALRDPDHRIAPRQALALVEEAIRATGDEDLGITLAGMYRPGAFGTLDYLAHSAGTLHEAIEYLIRYERVYQNGMKTTLTGDDATATISHEMVHPSTLPRQIMENCLASLLVIGRDLAGIDFAPLAVHFAHARPPDCRRHEAFFRCPIMWDAERYRLVIAPSLLSLPLGRANPKLAAVLEQHASDLLASLGNGRDLLSTTRDAICKLLPKGQASLSQVALVLRTNPRTLQRHLRAAGMPFETMLESLRKSLADKHLRNPRLGMADVSLLLGFSDTRSFRRAFQRWYQRSPAAYRRSLDSTK